ncbi:MAG TPA: VOC family protein [Acidimicrobiales bacterium]|nr:VOC family protein [Acidimicrobiales bacterium]
MSPLAARDPNERDEEVQSTQAGEVGPVLAEIDHVGVAVRDLATALDSYREAYDVLVEQREVDPEDGVEEALLRVGGRWVRLMAPHRDDSPLVAWLDEHGEGLHHVGYRVADCAATLAHLRAQGHEALDPFPRPGLRGPVVARVRDRHGTLVELVEDVPSF